MTLAAETEFRAHAVHPRFAEEASIVPEHIVQRHEDTLSELVGHVGGKERQINRLAAHIVNAELGRYEEKTAASRAARAGMRIILPLLPQLLMNRVACSSQRHIGLIIETT